MNITFINKSDINIIKLTLDEVEYFLQPQGLLNVPFTGGNNTFTAELLPNNDIGEIEPDKLEKENFKDKLLRKATNKFLKKVPEMALYSAVTYELQDVTSDTVVELESSVYSACDGEIADFFDIVPVVYCFPKAECAEYSIKVVKAQNQNIKQYLKLFRKILLFLNWGMLLLNLFEFIPTYIVLRVYATDFYISKLIKKLYALPKSERELLIAEKLGFEETEAPKKKKSFLKSFIKAIIVIAILGGIIFWGMTSEPEVILSEDFSQIQCYDETFVKVDTTLPENAKKSFLDEHTVYYILPDGEYDMENYYCYIYETESGERYLWLKDNCSLEENKNKQYEDYKNPLVYKSTGENE